MFEIIKKENKARRGRFHTVHGVIETPVFMNVGTTGAIRGGLSSLDLLDVNGVKTPSPRFIFFFYYFKHLLNLFQILF